MQTLKLRLLLLYNEYFIFYSLSTIKFFIFFYIVLAFLKKYTNDIWKIFLVLYDMRKILKNILNANTKARFQYKIKFKFKKSSLCFDFKFQT